MSRVISILRLTPVRRILIVAAGLVVGFSLCSAGTISVAWDPVKGATGYEILHGLEGGTPSIPMDVGPVHEATIHGLLDCRIHQVAVRAYNRTGFGESSTVLSGYPRPEIDSLGQYAFPRRRRIPVTVLGANFDEQTTVELLGPDRRLLEPDESAGILEVVSREFVSCNELRWVLRAKFKAPLGIYYLRLRAPEDDLVSVEVPIVLFDYNEPESIPDRLFEPPPTGPTWIRSMSPSAGTTGVVAGVQPSVELTHPVDPTVENLSSDNVRLLDDTNTALDQAPGSPFLADSEFRRLIVQPAEPLDYERDYRIEVRGGASGLRRYLDEPLGAETLQPGPFQTERRPRRGPFPQPPEVRRRLLDEAGAETAKACTTEQLAQPGLCSDRLEWDPFLFAQYYEVHRRRVDPGAPSVFWEVVGHTGIRFPSFVTREKARTGRWHVALDGDFIPTEGATVELPRRDAQYRYRVRACKEIDDPEAPFGYVTVCSDFSVEIEYPGRPFACFEPDATGTIAEVECYPGAGLVRN